MAMGPQNPFNGCPAGDFHLSPDEYGNVKVRPMLAAETSEMMAWVARKLNAPDLPLTEQVTMKLCCATLRVGGQHTICGLTRGHSGEHIAPISDLSWQEDTSEPKSDAVYGSSFLDIALGMRAKSPSRTDWVIARDMSNVATATGPKEQWLPTPHSGSPRQEVYWDGGGWHHDVNRAVRCRDTAAAIALMLDRPPGTWKGVYLARVAAKPEPRYEVVDRP